MLCVGPIRATREAIIITMITTCMTTINPPLKALICIQQVFRAAMLKHQSMNHANPSHQVPLRLPPILLLPLLNRHTWTRILSHNMGRRKVLLTQAPLSRLHLILSRILTRLSRLVRAHILRSRRPPSHLLLSPQCLLTYLHLTSTQAPAMAMRVGGTTLLEHTRGLDMMQSRIIRLPLQEQGTRPPQPRTIGCLQCPQCRESMG